MSKKIILKGANVKKVTQLLKRSCSLDSMIFISLKGSNFESTAYNRTKSALKSVTADVETMCEEFSNPFDETVKIQFSNANKLITTLGLVGEENVDLVFEIEDDNYAKKLTVRNSEMNVTVNCADKEAVNFLEIPDNAKKNIFEDTSKMQVTFNLADSEMRKIRSLMSLNKDNSRVFFNLVGEEIVVSEIESTDENVRSVVNDIIQGGDYEGFRKFDKLYDKKLIHTDLEIVDGVENYIGCFAKQYFDLIDGDKFYTIEFHTNKVKFISFDDDNVKTYVVMTPVRFT